jgi:LruC domain-containing protein
MRKIRVLKWASLCLLLGATASCSKRDPNTATLEGDASNTGELATPEGFDWSASFKGSVNVNFDNPRNISLENEPVYLISENGTVLKKAIVANQQVQFNVQLPEDANYYISFPNTGNRQKITGSQINMSISDNGFVMKKSKTNTSSCTACTSPFINGDMESPVILSKYTIINENSVPGWETDASDNKIEIWQSGFNGVPAQEGNQFFEMNANRPAALYQSLCLDPGSTIKWSVYHRGRAGVDVANVKIGSSLASATVQATMTDGTSGWGHHTGTYVVPAGQTTTLFIFEAVSAAGGSSVGNFIDNFKITCDLDGDGINDNEDDFPNDPNRAFTSYFPSAGKQVVAFEDLWPSLGDFDFNDMVLATQGVVTKDANNQLVEATFKVAVDAIGAGIHNGIAMMLYDANNQIIGNNIIASVSGDAALDPDNTNGLIVSSDIFTSISTYYQNNGTGPSATPDTLSFTINFNANAGSDFAPELYLFRANNRGHEVHLSGYPRTASLNQNLLNTADDNGDFKTSNGLPWAIEIITTNDYKNPIEKVDILDAYPQFQQWATSGGTDNVTWYNTPILEQVFEN